MQMRSTLLTVYVLTMQCMRMWQTSFPKNVSDKTNWGYFNICSLGPKNPREDYKTASVKLFVHGLPWPPLKSISTYWLCVVVHRISRKAMMLV